MKLQVKEKITKATIELDYEEMVQLRAALNRLKGRTFQGHMGHCMHPRAIGYCPYGSSGKGKFLGELHSKLTEITG